MKGIEIRSKGNRTGEVLVYGQIGEDWWTGEGVTAKKFAADLKALGSIDLLQVRINSEGGSVFDGVAIHNQLARHGARVEVDVDGMALSAASVIAMAGHEIRMAENAMMMVHNPYGVFQGDAAALRKAAEILEGVKDALVATYATRTGRAADDIAALMDAETWWTGEQAVAAKFADRVTAPVAVTNCGDLSRYKHGNAVAAALAARRDSAARGRIDKQKTRLAALSA